MTHFPVTIETEPKIDPRNAKSPSTFCFSIEEAFFWQNIGIFLTFSYWLTLRSLCIRNIKYTTKLCRSPILHLETDLFFLLISTLRRVAKDSKWLELIVEKICSVETRNFKSPGWSLRSYWIFVNYNTMWCHSFAQAVENFTCESPILESFLT